VNTFTPIDSTKTRIKKNSFQMKKSNYKEKNLDWTCILIYGACDYGLVKYLLIVLVIHQRCLPETAYIYFIGLFL
jgi:hypothetical protein